MRWVALALVIASASCPHRTPPPPLCNMERPEYLVPSCHLYVSTQVPRPQKSVLKLSARPSFKQRRQRIKSAVNALKSRPCSDCGGVFHPCAMDFDHRESGEKSFTVGTRVSGGAALTTLLAEIQKCDVVCSNCHRLRTWRRGKVRRAAAWMSSDQMTLFDAMVTQFDETEKGAV